MNEHIKLFETHLDYEEYINSQDKILPNVSFCKDLEEVHYNEKPHDYSQDYLTFVAKESGTFTFTPKNRNVISYSTNGGETWTEGNTVSVNNDNKVMWKGTMTPVSSYNGGIGTFSSTGNFDVQGNPMSLLFGDNYKGQTSLTGKNYAFYRLFYRDTNVINAENLSLPATTLADGCYYSMFYKCTNLTIAPELSATTLANGCYSNMFEGCTSLTSAPELPAETLASYCYNEMFRGCTSLTTAPELPATTLASYCYGNMFNGCTGLTTAPELPSETLANSCYYYMFRDCTSLVTAPVLSATTLKGNCYTGMFQDCTSLVTAPSVLPATTLVGSCYSSMFYGCTSLVSAPELPATTLTDSCYRGMFYGCTSLNHIKAMFTTTPGGTYTEDWVSGVAATGTFVKNMSATWNVSGDYGVPSGWTIELDSFGGDDNGEIDSQ